MPKKLIHVVKNNVCYYINLNDGIIRIYDTYYKNGQAESKLCKASEKRYFIIRFINNNFICIDVVCDKHHKEIYSDPMDCEVIKELTKEQYIKYLTMI